MALQNILDRIKKDYEEKIQNFHNEKNKEIAQILENTQKKAEKIKEKISNLGKKELEEIKKKQLALINLECKKEILNIKQDIIKEVFEKAYEKMIDLITKSDLLKKMIKENSQTKDEEIILSDKIQIQKNFINEINQEINGKFVLSSQKYKGYGFLLYKDKKFINCTIESLFDRLKEDFMVEINHILFEEKE